MRIGIVTPAVLQQRALLELTLESARHLVTACDATLYTICNGLHVCSVEELHEAPGRVLCRQGRHRERSRRRA